MGLAHIESARARIGRAEAKAAQAALIERLGQEALARAFRGGL